MYILRMEIYCYVPFLLFDQTKIPQKFFVDHDRYHTSKGESLQQHKLLSEDKSTQGQPISKDTRYTIVWFMRSSLGSSIIDLILRVLEARVLFRSIKRSVKSGYDFVHFESREVHRIHRVNVREDPLACSDCRFIW